ncbi:MAG: type II secretion system F family protein [Candidatus Pacearchaeota archaeon]
MRSEGDSNNSGEEVDTKREKVLEEIKKLSDIVKTIKDPSERKIIFSQIDDLKKELKKGKPQPLHTFETKQKEQGPSLESIDISKNKNEEKKVKSGDGANDLEKLILKRIKKGEKSKIEKKEIISTSSSKYIQFSNIIFYNLSLNLLNKGWFKGLKRDVIRANLKFVPASYLSVVFFTTILSFLLLLGFLVLSLFLSTSSSFPFLVVNEEILWKRLLDLSWVLIVVPIIIFSLGILYPSMERKSAENRINNELPFAAMHMASVSTSMIEPSKIFNVLISTKEYPNLEKEFIKIRNEINIYGHDIVTALKNVANNNPSEKLAELLNGVAITITSGGSLSKFFEKRAQSLLFEYRVEMEKQSKAAETFMDIYISVVIAAPMILMLLLIIMNITGFGFSLNPLSITLIIITSVSLINILFLIFLHLRQSNK